jgi:hypothetical protein
VSALAVDDPLHPVMGEGETLLWQGPIGFNFTSSPVTVMALLVAAGYAFWATWGSYSATEFCLGARSDRGCGSIYWLLGPTLLAATAGQGFDLLERFALTKGTAKGAVILTSHRLIRVSDWPSRRVRGYDHRTNSPHWGLRGVIRFGRFGNIILRPDDARQVRQRITDNGRATP